MRPPAQHQSVTRNPLNVVFGREATVRILRVLALEPVPVARPELARLAQLQPRGMKRLLELLEDAGAIESVGRGRRQAYRLRAQFALTNGIQMLFAQEQQRARSIFDGIGQTVNAQGSSVRAAWIEGAVATNEDRLGDSVVLVLLAGDADAEQMRRNVRAGLNELQRRLDVPIELKIVYQADLEALSPEQRAALETTLSVSGPPPRHFIEPSVPAQTADRGSRTHAGRDAQLLDRAREIAIQIARDPTLIDRARAWIERRRTVASPGEQVELGEWHDILTTMSPARVRRLLVQPGERATRLRQSMPFPGDAQ